MYVRKAGCSHTLPHRWPGMSMRLRRRNLEHEEHSCPIICYLCNIGRSSDASVRHETHFALHSYRGRYHDEGVRPSESYFLLLRTSHPLLPFLILFVHFSESQQRKRTFIHTICFFSANRLLLSMVLPLRSISLSITQRSSQLIGVIGLYACSPS